MSGYLNFDKNGLSIDNVILDLIRFTNKCKSKKNKIIFIIKQLDNKDIYGEYNNSFKQKKQNFVNHISDILENKDTSIENIYSDSEKKQLEEIKKILEYATNEIQKQSDKDNLIPHCKEYLNTIINNNKPSKDNPFIKNAKNIKDIKKNLENIKNIFYNNFDHKVINFGKKIGIWKNSNYELSHLSMKTLNSNGSDDDKVKNYLNKIIFNLLLCKEKEKKKIMYNPIFTLLNNYDIKNRIISNESNLSDDEKKEFWTFIENFLKYEEWLKLEENESNEIVNVINLNSKKIEELKTKCNLNYHNKSYEEYEMIGSNLINLSYYLGIEPRKISRQKIYFGSPGTGKSYRVNQDLKEIYPDKIIRTTFHPSYYYSDFIAVYKPLYNETTNNTIFKIVLGPLIYILVKALKNPDKNYLLIIDEINRANVSEVFGDFFQLIERNKEGMSEYKINVKKDLWNHLKKKLNSLLLEGLYFPPNLYIWATMNSSDQGTFPLDTAFKRRWDFEYIGIDDNEKEVENICFKIPNDNKKIKWNEFRKLINEKLLKINNTINEDKLLGPFFIGGNLDKDDLEGNGEIIKNKVIPYLYEDVLKFLGAKAISEIFTSNKDSKKEEVNVILTLSEIIKKFEKEEIKNVFNFDEKEIEKIEEKE